MQSKYRPLAMIAPGAIAAALLTHTADAAGTSVPLSEISHIHGIAVDATDPSRVYLATHHGLYLASSDGIATEVSATRNDYMGFTPHPNDPAVLYASGHPAEGGNLGVIVSEDGGKNWRRLADGS